MSLRRYRLSLLVILLICMRLPLLSEEGTWTNPITEVCWECLFPITVSGVNVVPGTQDLSGHSQRTCSCAGTPPKIGVPLTFWEPARFVDVTRHAYKMLAF